MLLDSLDRHAEQNAHARGEENPTISVTILIQSKGQRVKRQSSTTSDTAARVQPQQVNDVHHAPVSAIGGTECLATESDGVSAIQEAIYLAIEALRIPDSFKCGRTLEMTDSIVTVWPLTVMIICW